MKTSVYRFFLASLLCFPISAHPITPPSDTSLLSLCGDTHTSSDIAALCIQYRDSTSVVDDEVRSLSAIQKVRAATYPAAQGKILFASDRGSDNGTHKIYAIKANGTGLLRLTSGSADDSDARFSPSGAAIAFIRGGNQIWMMNSDGSNQRYLLDGDTVAFSANGSALLYSSGGDIYTYDITTKASSKIIDGGIYSGYNTYPDVSAKGDTIWINKFLFAYPFVKNIFKTTLKNPTTTSNLTKFTEFNEGYANGVRWSPDATKILFHCQRFTYYYNTPIACDSQASSSNYELYTMNSGGSGIAKIKINATNNVWGVWSPDANYIAFRSGANPPQSIYITKADGSALRRLTVDTSGHESYPTDWRLSEVGYALTIRKTGKGSGTVTSSPSGISCGSICSKGYAHNKIVKLIAKAHSSSLFVGWSGACSGKSPTCTVTMAQARAIIAAFSLKP